MLTKLMCCTSRLLNCASAQYAFILSRLAGRHCSVRACRILLSVELQLYVRLATLDGYLNSFVGTHIELWSGTLYGGLMVVNLPTTYRQFRPLGTGDPPLSHAMIQYYSVLSSCMKVLQLQDISIILGVHLTCSD